MTAIGRLRLYEGQPRATSDRVDCRRCGPRLRSVTMALARKIILHSQIEDEGRLAGFVEECLADGVSLLAIFGPGSEELAETIDWLVVGDASDPSRFLCTTSHPKEPFETVLNMARTWEFERGDSVQEVRL